VKKKSKNPAPRLLKSEKGEIQFENGARYEKEKEKLGAEKRFSTRSEGPSV